MKKSTMLAGVVAIAMTGAAQAGEPMQLSSTQMDGVTAGAVFITSNAAANAIQQFLALNVTGTASTTQAAAATTTTNSTGASASASGSLSGSATALLQSATAFQALAQFSYVSIP
jgi:hypothetical protein